MQRPLPDPAQRSREFQQHAGRLAAAGTRIGPPAAGNPGTGADQSAFAGPTGTMPPPIGPPGGIRISRLPAITPLPGTLPGNAMPAADMADPAADRPALPQPRRKRRASGGRGPRQRAGPCGQRHDDAGLSGRGEKPAPVPFGLPATFGGAEIIAWVGPEVILASDVLARRQSAFAKDPRTRLRRLPPAEEVEHVAEVRTCRIPGTRHRDQTGDRRGQRRLPKEAWGKIEKQFNEQFDKEYLKKMIDSEECRSRTELDLKLRKTGSSLEGISRQAMENSFAQHWIEEKVRDDHEITHEEMHAYYRAHLADYETPAKVAGNI